MSLGNSYSNSSILVYKSYGGIGDIFFTLPSLYMLKQKFNKVTYATQPRLVHLFSKHLDGIEVVSEDEVDESLYDEVIELGNYPKFSNDLEKQPQITYHTHKKVKQHAIEHYKDGIISKFPDIVKSNERYPYFEQIETDELYYTVHPGAGFLLKAWPVEYYARLIEIIHDKFPELKVKIIIGPNDPNPESLFSSENLKYELITGDIDEVAETVSGAFFHIGNDAGMTHLAGAFNIPILTIYGPTGPGSWGAFSEHVELIWGKRGNCGQRCNYNVILACEDRVCLNNVSPQKMMFLLLRLLKRIGTQPSFVFQLNPDFDYTMDDKAVIFKSKDNEYLIDIHDSKSYQFIEENLQENTIDTEHMPKQFMEIFDALIQLELFEPLPKILALKHSL
ncbi:glycosyltransferase family 9 protein [Psychroserpens sp. XS_ASV72]|uniref:glycosyltransferase family 9 protein n=1 Tax=Psychroserpens sp. XS_ASV72 TaxID=3241293 RepID=UPI00351437E5